MRFHIDQVERVARRAINEVQHRPHLPSKLRSIMKTTDWNWIEIVQHVEFIRSTKSIWWCIDVIWFEWHLIENWKLTKFGHRFMDFFCFKKSFETWLIFENIWCNSVRFHENWMKFNHSFKYFGRNFAESKFQNAFILRFQSIQPSSGETCWKMDAKMLNLLQFVRKLLWNWMDLTCYSCQK